MRASDRVELSAQHGRPVISCRALARLTLDPPKVAAGVAFAANRNAVCGLRALAGGVGERMVRKPPPRPAARPLRAPVAGLEKAALALGRRAVAVARLPFLAAVSALAVARFVLKDLKGRPRDGLIPRPPAASQRLVRPPCAPVALGASPDTVLANSGGHRPIRLSRPFIGRDKRKNAKPTAKMTN